MSVLLDLIVLFLFASSCTADVNVSKVALKSGHLMPVIGFGTLRLKEKTYQLTKEAIDIGYRLFDAAKEHKTYTKETSEEAVGRAIADSGIPRSEFFITTKILPNDFDLVKCRNAVDNSLNALRTSYIDLLMIHYPECEPSDPSCKQTVTFVEAWKNMEQLVREGKVRDLGVSNFYVEEIEKVWMESKIKPSVVQNWFDPYYEETSLLHLSRMNRIAVQAHSTLGAAYIDDGMKTNPILNNKLIKEIANKNNLTPSNVILGWVLSKNVTLVVGSTNITHMQQNLESFKIKLDKDDLIKIDGLNGRDPKHFDVDSKSIFTHLIHRFRDLFTNLIGPASSKFGEL